METTKLPPLSKRLQKYRWYALSSTAWSAVCTAWAVWLYWHGYEFTGTAMLGAACAHGYMVYKWNGLVAQVRAQLYGR